MWGKQWTLPGFFQAFDTLSHSLLLQYLMCDGPDLWSVQWVGNWPTGGTQKGMANSSFWNWHPVKSVVPQGLILGPIPFNIFLSDLDDGIKCTLMKIATRLIRKVDVSEGRATLQQDLDRLEDRVHKNLMKFNKDKCKVLCLGSHSPGVQHRLGSTWLGTSSMKKSLEVLVDSKLRTSEQGAAVAKEVKRMLSYINKDIPTAERKKTFSHSSQLLSGHILNPEFNFGSCFTKEMQTSLTGPRERPQRCPSDREACLPYEERLRGLCLFSPEKRRLRAYPITVFQYLKDDCKEDEDFLFISSHTENMRGNGYKLCLGTFQLDKKRNFFSQ